MINNFYMVRENNKIELYHRPYYTVTLPEDQTSNRPCKAQKSNFNKKKFFF